jgi:hypothetical protein
MKNYPISLLGWMMVTFILSACHQRDEGPAINPLVGEWTALDDQFLTIWVNGEEKSLSAFGMEVLRTNEEGGTQAAMEYLQHNFLGPIDIAEPKLMFLYSGELNAVVTGQAIEGIWQFINDRTVLTLSSADLDDNSYLFNVKKLTLSDMVLDWNWEMTYLGENAKPFHVLMEIKLVK